MDQIISCPSPEVSYEGMARQALVQFSTASKYVRLLKLDDHMIMHNMKTYYVYIVTNKPRGRLYTGVSSNLYVRIYQHKNKIFKSSFTKRYNLDKLVYYEQYQYVQDAIKREKQIKGLVRLKKIKLIEKINPKWDDLFQKIPKTL